MTASRLYLTLVTLVLIAVLRELYIDWRDKE